MTYANTYAVSERQSNRVLRNTYWLLTASMIPTIAGAWLGISMGLISFFTMSPFVAFIAFLIIGFGFIVAIQATKESGWGIAILLAFTFFIGMMMSPLIGNILGKSNGGQLITLAIGGTAAIFAAMATLSSFIKKDISNWGKYLIIAVVGLIIAMIANIWLQISALAIVISVVAVIVFSAFLLYDLKRIVDGGETNYITATLSVYLSVINIFQHLLALLGYSND